MKLKYGSIQYQTENPLLTCLGENSVELLNQKKCLDHENYLPIKRKKNRNRNLYLNKKSYLGNPSSFYFALICKKNINNFSFFATCH
jgi:hypothetical protein